MNVTTLQSKQILKKYGRENTGILFERLIKTRLTYDQIYLSIYRSEQEIERMQRA